MLVIISDMQSISQLDIFEMDNEVEGLYHP